MYLITDEGKYYIKNGLPEVNLTNIITSPMKFEEARKKIDNFNIAFQWAKKNGWIEVRAGKIYLSKKPSKTIEDALKKIENNESVDDKTLSLLLKRKLIEEKKETIVKRAEGFVGKEISGLTEEIIKTDVWKKVTFRKYNVSAVGKKIYPGKRQPYNKFLIDVRRKLIELGFREMTGPTIELEFWNFDALYQAQNHPSRDWTETYNMKYPVYGRLPDKKIVNAVRNAHENGGSAGSTGWKYKWNEKKASRLMPRAHGTALSSRHLVEDLEIPGKYFSISRCYRPDVIDATHGVEFNQTEGFIIDESLTIKHLLGILKEFATELTGASKIRFFSDYYPFTEPSVQLSAKHPEIGWVELGGAGIFREELTKPLGVDEPVIAWGLGIDRLAMFNLGIDDIRMLFSQDLNWLREQKVL